MIGLLELLHVHLYTVELGTFNILLQGYVTINFVSEKDSRDISFPNRLSEIQFPDLQREILSPSNPICLGF